MKPNHTARYALTAFVLGFLAITGGCLGIAFGAIGETELAPYGAGCEDPLFEFNCGDTNGGCIDYQLVCNGENNCANDYDEDPEVCELYG